MWPRRHGAAKSVSLSGLLQSVLNENGHGQVLSVVRYLASNVRYPHNGRSTSGLRPPPTSCQAQMPDFRYCLLFVLVYDVKITLCRGQVPMA